MPDRSPEIWDLVNRMHQLEARVQSLVYDVRGTEEARKLAGAAADTAKREAREAHLELQRVRGIADQAVSRTEMEYRRRQSRWLVVIGVIFALVLATGFALLYLHTNRVQEAQRAYAHDHCLADNQALQAQRVFYRDFIAAIKKDIGPIEAAERLKVYEAALAGLPPDSNCDVPS